MNKPRTQLWRKAGADRKKSRGKVRREFARDNESVSGAARGAQGIVCSSEAGVRANTGNDESGVASEGQG